MKKLFLLGAAFVALTMGFSSCEKDEDDDNSSKEVLIVDDITTVTTWVASKVYVIDGDIDVNANLTIEPGTVIKFKTGASLGFGYTSNVTLTANGTSDKRIVFTSYNATPTPGSWEGIFLYGNVLQNSSITYCDFLYAGHSDWSAVDIRCKLTFSNNRVKYAKKVGIELNEHGSFVAMSDNTITDCGTNAMIVPPSAIHTLGTNNTMTCNSGYGIFVEEGDVTVTNGANLTWRKQPVAYIFDGTITVETNLTIEAGTILSFNAGGRIDFGYSANMTLTAVGTSTSPITFTSSNTTPAAGAWRGLYIYKYTSPNTTFDYCNFEYAGYDQEACLYIREIAGITAKNCNFKNSSGWGIHLDNGATLSATSLNNTFTNCALGNILSEI